MELNCASNSRKVEREFALSNKFNLLTIRRKNITEIKPSSLTNHFKDHFKKREEIEMPEELVHPEMNPELFNDQKLNINSNPPDKGEITSALKSFNNGKSYGTDNTIPTEAIKYGTSSNLLITAIWMLLQSIWITMTIPSEWLKLSINCIFKKGSKQLASNYRALSVGSNISKILSRIIVTRLKECYEENISNAQFGFRQDRSTTDGVFIMPQLLKNTEGSIIALYIDLTAAFDKNVLKDNRVKMKTRKKILESCMRSRLLYCSEAQLPNEDELKKLETCWFGLLRRMIKNGWKRKKDSDGEETFAFKYKTECLNVRQPDV
ncbi:hypothetical protein AC249_AIPGENE15244 [Exaiptasia diaphana]|nr:hypothetical protein AC249_AIPGENE15244 [Exaiptasia diaphana]